MFEVADPVLGGVHHGYPQAAVPVRQPCAMGAHLIAGGCVSRTESVLHPPALLPGLSLQPPALLHPIGQALHLGEAVLPGNDLIAGPAVVAPRTVLEAMAGLRHRDTEHSSAMTT